MSRLTTLALLALATLAGCGKEPEAKTNPTDMPVEKRWELVRGVIQHEDQLINDRLTTYLTMQGFLLTVAGIIITAFVDRNASNTSPREKRLVYLLFSLTFLVSAVGVLTSLFAVHGLGAASHHIHVVTDWWHDVGKVKKDNQGYPEIIGRYGYLEQLTSYNLPYCFMGIWAIIFALIMFFFTGRRFGRSRDSGLD